ncbi:ATPase AAA-type core, partial [Trinorchestia longiramus]
DGVGALTEQVLVVGATNRPQELDEAARRRLVKRLYIPLPDLQARGELVEVLLRRQQHTLTAADVAWVASNTEGFSGADIASLCSEAAMGPVRDIDPCRMRHVTLDQVRPISVEDFRNSVKSVRPSVCQGDLALYTEWNAKFGITRTLRH